MSNDALVVQLITNYTLRRPNDFLSLVDHQLTTLPQYEPKKWGWFEPLRNSFTRTKLWELIPEQGKMDSIYWDGFGKKDLSGSWAVGRRRRDLNLIHPGYIFISMQRDIIQEDALVTFLKTCNQVKNVCIGYIDAVTENYVPIGNDNGFMKSGYMFLTIYPLRHYLPDIPWATVFGREYIDLFGMDKLLSVPAYHVEQPDDESVYIQLTSDIQDLFCNFDEVMAAREQVKQHLGYDCFYQEDKHYRWEMNENNKSGSPYRVPEFKILDAEELPPKPISPPFVVKEIDVNDPQSLIPAIQALIPCETTVVSTKANTRHVMKVYQDLTVQGESEGFTPVLIIPTALGYALQKEGIRAGGPADYLHRAEQLSFADVFAHRLERIHSQEEQQELTGEFVDIPDKSALKAVLLDAETCKEHPQIIVAQVPTAEAWQTPAWIPMGANLAEHPSIEEQIVYFRHWFEKYGARPAICGYDTWKLRVTVPAKSQEDAMQLAWEQFSFADDIVLQGTNTIGTLAGILYDSHVWSFWWD